MYIVLSFLLENKYVTDRIQNRFKWKLITRSIHNDDVQILCFIKWYNEMWKNFFIQYLQNFVAERIFEENEYDNFELNCIYLGSSLIW